MRILTPLLIAVIFLAFVVLSGCDSLSNPEIRRLTKEVATLEGQIEVLLKEAVLAEYVPGLTVVRRATPPPGVARKKVCVYVDGLLTQMYQHDLDHMIDIGFFIVTEIREW